MINKNAIIFYQKKMFKHLCKHIEFMNTDLHELFVAFKERNPDMKVGFFNFCTIHPKRCVIAGSSGTHLVCVCTTHQNTILLVDALNWEVTYKDLVRSWQ